MKKILITGASGFIGGFLVKEALNRGYETWAGADYPAGNACQQAPQQGVLKECIL